MWTGDDVIFIICGLSDLETRDQLSEADYVRAADRLMAILAEEGIARLPCVKPQACVATPEIGHAACMGELNRAHVRS